MSHPFFHFFQTYRQSPEQVLLHPEVAAVKRYPLAKTHSLPTPRPVLGEITQLLKHRRSWRQFATLTVRDEDLSSILYWGMSPQAVANDGSDMRRRPYPSGGAKYPIEAYVARVASDRSTIILSHYRPDTHSLETISAIDMSHFDKIRASYMYEFVKPVETFVWFSLLLERNMPKYGSLAFKLGLIEAGHIAQNMTLAAQAVGVESLPLAGGSGELIEQALGLDGYNESILYSLALGKAYDT